MKNFIAILLLSCLGTIGVAHARIPAVEDRWQDLYQDRFGIRYGVDDTFDANSFDYGTERSALLQTKKDDLAAVGSRPKRSDFAAVADWRAAVKDYNADRLVINRAFSAAVKDLNNARRYVSMLAKCYRARACRNRISLS